MLSRAGALAAQVLAGKESTSWLEVDETAPIVAGAKRRLRSARKLVVWDNNEEAAHNLEVLKADILEGFRVDIREGFQATSDSTG